MIEHAKAREWCTEVEVQDECSDEDAYNFLDTTGCGSTGMHSFPAKSNTQYSRQPKKKKKTCWLGSDLDVNDLNINMIYDKTLWCHLIHVI